MINKEKLRILYRSIRNSFNSKEKVLLDQKITAFFVNSELYKNSKIIFVYVSAKGEVDTLNLIKIALSDGKKVAVPYCCEQKMKFYFIKSLDELSEGSFGIPEPIPDESNIAASFDNAVCIVPGLSFDCYGNRLGYGGGYYDRFLSKNNMTTIGFCYERCLCHKLPSEEYDIKTNYILTENCLRNSKKEVST
jgi:5-formyltetrahydrofolate cyclo-ligase